MIQQFCRILKKKLFTKQSWTLTHSAYQKIALTDSCRQKHKMYLQNTYWPRAVFLEDLLLFSMQKNHQNLCRQHHFLKFQKWVLVPVLHPLCFLQGCCVACTAYSNTHRHFRGNREPEVQAKQIKQDPSNTSVRADIFPVLICPLLTIFFFWLVGWLVWLFCFFATPKPIDKLQLLFSNKLCSQRDPARIQVGCSSTVITAQLASNA